jgi:hypothetical protein
MSLEDILEYNPERHVKFNIEFDEWRRYPQLPNTPTKNFFFLLKAPLAPCLSWLYHIISHTRICEATHITRKTRAAEHGDDKQIGPTTSD